MTALPTTGATTRPFFPRLLDAEPTTTVADPDSCQLSKFKGDESPRRHSITGSGGTLSGVADWVYCPMCERAQQKCKRAEVAQNPHSLVQTVQSQNPPQCLQTGCNIHRRSQQY